MLQQSEFITKEWDGNLVFLIQVRLKYDINFVSLHLHKAIFSHYSPNFGNNSTAFSWEQTKFFKRIDLGLRITV